MTREAKVLTNAELKERAKALENAKPKGKQIPGLEEVVDSKGRVRRIRSGG